MEAASQSEPSNQDGFAAFAERADEETPVVMLNLLSFKPDGGRERYEAYGEVAAPLLEKAGGRIIFIGEPAAPLLGDDSWDLVVLAEYPTRRALLNMIATVEYQNIGHLRSEALRKGELHPVDPI